MYTQKDIDYAGELSSNQYQVTAPSGGSILGVKANSSRVFLLISGRFANPPAATDIGVQIGSLSGNGSTVFGLITVTVPNFYMRLDDYGTLLWGDIWLFGNKSGSTVVNVTEILHTGPYKG